VKFKPHKKKRLLEFVVLFIAIPLLLATPIFPMIRLGLGLAGIIYVIFISRKLKFLSAKRSAGIKMQQFYFLVCRFVLIGITTYFIVLEFYPKQLFKPLFNNPIQFAIICFIYMLGSVIPQEFIYRKFFYKRYHSIFPNERIFIFINGILFCLAHLFFYNKLVLLMTLIGGWIFSYTYLQTKSLRFTILEHALYGCWIYAVGLGSLLGFPE